MKNQEFRDFSLAVAASVTGGLVAMWIVNSLTAQSFQASELVKPGLLAEVAGSFPSDEGGFVLSACQYVSEKIEYEARGTDVNFSNSRANARGLYLPETTLKRGKGNCIGMSSVLASLLRNRIPPERVFLTIGEILLDGVGGHSWVELKENGNWSIIEATKPKLIPVSVGRKTYVPYIYLNDRYFKCLDGEYCKVKVNPCCVL